eukprot:CAMPEP_0197043010 /NCGR_PEP_ID=MMETSP1384-20130603/19305_1 /TAXON_ID=29189 /ORGANISM="Ammonia sp." /LENGTH=45 /DNA_ID= /DNA_START= /DNA_END= /DNA_ORIENTATION=
MKESLAAFQTSLKHEISSVLNAMNHREDEERKYLLVAMKQMVECV